MVRSEEQPLLHTSHTQNHSPWKSIILAVLCLTAIIATSIVIFGPNLRSNNIMIISNHDYLCRLAQDPSSCSTTIMELIINGGGTSSDPHELLTMLLEKSKWDLERCLLTSWDLVHRMNGVKVRSPMADCLELLEISVDRLVDSIDAIKAKKFWDAHSWLSGVLTNYRTCFDGLHESHGPSLAREVMEPHLDALIQQARTNLAVFVAVAPQHEETKWSSFPPWLSEIDKKRLLVRHPKDLEANVVVAKDGSGNYSTVGEAIERAPNGTKDRYVIHVKKGTYKENVEIGSNKINVMLVGDGMNSTIITGSLNNTNIGNVTNGTSTYGSATFAAVGDGFMAQDIWFQNTAGPERGQAVALRIGADKSVINRCKIDAYQDTLYVHTNNQFYRDSYITGTIDFIFGNAAVVFQNCTIVARMPMQGQQNMITAQKKDDPKQITGISIQQCNITASPDLEKSKGSVQTFLGRPWGNHSTTVYMESYMGDHIDPAGWSAWDDKQSDPPSTLYYGEYKNFGPGADTSNRVKWVGYHVITNASEAQNFTVSQLINGLEWLPERGVPFIPDL